MEELSSHSEGMILIIYRLGLKRECLMGKVETWIYGKDVGISSCKL